MLRTHMESPPEAISRKMRSMYLKDTGRDLYDFYHPNFNRLATVACMSR